METLHATWISDQSIRFDLGKAQLVLVFALFLVCYRSSPFNVFQICVIVTACLIEAKPHYSGAIHEIVFS